MSIRTILVASILASIGAVAGLESAGLAQPELPPPPAPMYQPQPEPEPAYPPPAPSYTPQQQPAQPYPPAGQQPAQPYPPAQPAPQQPAQVYPPPAQPAPQQQPAPAYPPPQQPATGYPQPGQSYPPQQPQGYPAPQQPQTYPPQQPQGYPAPQQPQTTYPAPQPAYPAQQPQGYPPPPPAGQQDYPPPPPAPEAKSESIFSNPLSKLQVGFLLGTGSLTADNRTYDSDLTSFGIFARYRFNQRWEAELGVSSDSGTVKANGAQREFTPITAAALWHVFDLRGLDVYARLGLGRATETYNNPAFRPLEGPTTHINLGAGATYIFRGNIGAGVELRWQSIRRGATDEISALNASGTTYHLFGAYHF